MLDLLKNIAVILSTQFNSLKQETGHSSFQLEFSVDDQKMSVAVVQTQTGAMNLKELKKLLKTQLSGGIPRGARFENSQNSEGLDVLKVEFPIQDSEYEQIDFESLMISLQSFVEFFEMKAFFWWEGEKLRLNHGGRPLWRQDTSETDNDEYLEFYQTYYQEDDEILPWVYVKVYEPLCVEGLLFFRRRNPYRVVGENKSIKTLVEQAAVQEFDLLEYLPESFKASFGVLEIKDLKISDISTFKCSKTLKELAQNITYNVAESIRRLNRKNRTDYENAWASLSFFTKSSCMHDQVFDQTMRPHILYKRAEGQYINLSELDYSVPGDPSSPRHVLYYDSSSVDPRLLSMASRYKLEPVALEDELDPLFIQYEESTPLAGHNVFSFTSFEFRLAQMGPKSDSKEHKDLKSLVENFLKQFLPSAGEDEVFSEVNFEVKDFQREDPPLFIYLNEEDRRFFYNSRFQIAHDPLPLRLQLVVNAVHPEVQSLLEWPEDKAYYALKSFFLSSYQYVWNQAIGLRRKA